LGGVGGKKKKSKKTGTGGGGVGTAVINLEGSERVSTGQEAVKITRKLGRKQNQEGAW